MSNKNIRINKKFILILAIIGAIFYFLFSLQLGPPKRSADSIRNGDLTLIRVALELYADDNKSLYPPVSSSCLDVNILNQYLVSNKYLDSIPSDPKLEDGHPNYMIAVHPERTEYVLRAFLEGSDFLGRDLDGMVMGCDCNDPGYCLGSNSNKF